MFYLYLTFKFYLSMSQEFQILRCYECEKFQVHHVKKAKKWQCFFIGSSRDCRLNVQKLNFQAGMHQFNRMLYESNNSSEALNIDENNSSEIFNSLIILMLRKKIHLVKI
ncbi:MRN complex-interacting protein [Caerostris extrusa]|uniref:MRN complex-interacting protein n=1 Tax=Caerostris extrusa TaxID=172846 RepID=A0AAV4NPN9_CAEEX|nr:MRN complex-interacting protein [Caerostris extrusa]